MPVDRGGGQAVLLSNVRSNDGEAGSPGDTPHQTGMNIEHQLYSCKIDQIF